MDKDIGQVEHKLGVNQRPATSRPATRAKTYRGGRRGRRSVAEEEPEPVAKRGNNKSRVVSEVCISCYFIVSEVCISCYFIVSGVGGKVATT